VNMGLSIHTFSDGRIIDLLDMTADSAAVPWSALYAVVREAVNEVAVEDVLWAPTETTKSFIIMSLYQMLQTHISYLFMNDPNYDYDRDGSVKYASGLLIKTSPADLLHMLPYAARRPIVASTHRVSSMIIPKIATKMGPKALHGVYGADSRFITIWRALTTAKLDRMFGVGQHEGAPRQPMLDDFIPRNDGLKKVMSDMYKLLVVTPCKRFSFNKHAADGAINYADEKFGDLTQDGDFRINDAPIFSCITGWGMQLGNMFLPTISPHNNNHAVVVELRGGSAIDKFTNDAGDEMYDFVKRFQDYQ